jgi:hypothetical protein
MNTIRYTLVTNVLNIFYEFITKVFRRCFSLNTGAEFRMVLGFLISFSTYLLLYFYRLKFLLTRC